MAGTLRTGVGPQRQQLEAGRGRLITGWRERFGGPLLIFAATRVVQLLLIVWLMPAGSSLLTSLLSWDSGWFIRVASEGYPHSFTYDAAGNLTANGLAFFPLYPGLIRLGHLLGLTYDASALTVSWLAAAIAAVLLYALAVRLFDRPIIGYALVALFCAQPMSVVLSMGYSESLFVALVAGMFLATLGRRWLLAGTLGALAGLTRPTGAAAGVALAVAVGMLIAKRQAGRGEIARACSGAVLALLAVPAYIAWVGFRVGDPAGWFKIQTAGWGTTFDFGAATWSFAKATLTTDNGWVAMSVLLILVVATVALVMALRERIWPPLTTYGVIAFVLVVGQAGYYHSKPRLLVPVLLILLPAALAAGRSRPRSVAVVLTAYALFGLWYGAYMITIWPYAI
jgi:hypothetical protein